MTEKQLHLPGIDQAEKTTARRKRDVHYQWTLGEQPPMLGEHSIAKHQVLRAYLERYVAILAGRPSQEQLKLTLVDGFAGGGVYLHPTSRERIPGSPLIMLQAMSAAELAANAARKKQFRLDAEYFFIEKRPPTVEFLRTQLADTKEAHDQAERVHVLTGSFSGHLDAIIESVEQRGRSRRAIFILDQYGYKDVRLADLRAIFRRLPKAEVILTVAIDWLIDHWSDGPLYTKILKNLDLELEAQLADQIKAIHPNDWRPVIQHLLHQEFFRSSGAAFYTPFFIHSVEAHRAYWLLHFSGHEIARNAMTDLHWGLNNHFQHFGQPGFTMLGFDPRRDLERIGQLSLPFAFDSTAAGATMNALCDQIPARIASCRDGISLRAFFRAVANETPATKAMIAKAISSLTLEKELSVRNKHGTKRSNGVQILDDDIIIRPKQKGFTW